VLRLAQQPVCVDQALGLDVVPRDADEVLSDDDAASTT
jgi:hypothetical protein